MKKEECVRKAALEGAEKYLHQQLRLLEAFSRIDCGVGNVEGNAAAVEIAERILKEIKNIQLEFIEKQGVGKHIIARIVPKEKKGKIILNAHLDTVFQKGFAEKYPFHIQGDYAYGLGVADDKSGFVTSVFAVKIMQEAGFLPDYEIAMIYGCDEENGSVTGQEIYKQESKDADFAFVFEGGKLAEDGKTTGLVTSRKGVAIGTIEVTGKEAHAGVAFEEGRSATYELAHKLMMLYSFCKPEKKLFYNPSPISGGRPNGVVAGEAKADFCVGLPSMADYKIVKEDLKKLESNIFIDGCTVKTTHRLLFPTMEWSDKNHMAFAICKKGADLLGIPVKEITNAASTDACYFSSYGVGTVDALAPYTRNVHTTYESMHIPSLQEKTALFAAALGCLY